MDEKQTIKQYLENDQSKENRDAIIDFVGDDTGRLGHLMEMFLDTDLHWRYNQRAAWPIGVLGRKKPYLINPYLSRMVNLLGPGNHDAVNRNILRILEDLDVHEDLEGIVFDKCYNFLNDPDYSIAIRAFSMTVLFNIASKYPETLPELYESIQLHLPYGSTGFKNRGNKILLKIEKILSNIQE